jgi:hypothetical protein
MSLMMVPESPRFGIIASDYRCERDQAENAKPHGARGSQVCAKHEIPVPVSDLITGS